MVQFKQPLTSTTSATDSVAILCTVQNVDLTNLIASVVDQTGTPRKVSLKVMPGKCTDYPVAGERWIISREYGDWMFVATVNVTPNPSAGPQGAQGPQGASGVQGAQGAPGAQAAEPTGAIIMYGAASAPTGWLVCDGTAVSRTTYSALFAIIGTTYGVGDGSTTFTLPDFTSAFARGNTVGTGGGADTHTHTSAAHTHTSAAHSHTLSNAGAAKIYASTTALTVGTTSTASWTDSVLSTLSGAASSASRSIGSGLIGSTDSATPGVTGSTTPSNTGSSSNVPVYTGVTFIIKT